MAPGTVVPVDPDDLLVDLDPAQRHAVTTDAAPLCVLAGAGSGKTRVLTRRVAWRCATGRADPSKVLVLTFTRAAAREVRGRLQRLGVGAVTAGTFHAVAWAQLRARHAAAGTAAPALLARRQDLVVELLRQERRGGRAGPSRAARDVAAELDWAKARLVGPEHYVEEAVREGRSGPEQAEGVAAVYAAYERAKRRRGLVDFDDLLWRGVEVLEAGGPDAAAARWRAAHLFVDEFQDVNPLQFRLLEAWRGGRGDLSVVGDPRQSIYAWNGAAPDLIERFGELYPDGTVVAVDRGYRSTPQIARTAEAVLPAAAASAHRRVAVRADGAPPTLTGYADEAAEAAAVARGVLDEHRPGGRWRRQAVLARTNALLRPLAAALRAAGVPHRTRAAGPLAEHAAVRRWVAEHRRSRLELTEAVAVLSARLEDGDADLVGDDARALLRLAEAADEHRRLGGDATIDALLEHLAASGDDTAPGGDAVELVTFHAAKGLEWPVVHVIGLEDGTVPTSHARTATALAEERRLLYVAMTRAEDRLHLTWARSRPTGSGRTVARRPSPFLADVAPLLSEQRREGSGVDARPGLDAARHQLVASAGEPTPATASERAREAIEQWRTSTARRADLPPAAVLADRAVLALARALPSDHATLRQVDELGPVLLSAWGDDLLAVLAEAARTRGPDDAPTDPEDRRS